ASGKRGQRRDKDRAEDSKACLLIRAAPSAAAAPVRQDGRGAEAFAAIQQGPSIALPAILVFAVFIKNLDPAHAAHRTDGALVALGLRQRDAPLDHDGIAAGQTGNARFAQLKASPD